MCLRLLGVLACVCAAIALGTSGCSSATNESPDAVVTDKSSPRAAPKSFPEASNYFAFDLFGRLRNEDGNLVMSPISVSTAFSMVLAGARGRTAEEIASVLYLHGLPREDAHPAAAEMRNVLNGRGNEHTFTLSIANRLWAAQDQIILDGYSALVKKQYGAVIGRVDFIGGPDAAVKQINGWVASATRGKIPTVIGRQHVDNLTRLVLVNAVYFLGKWNWAFEKEDTSSLDFFLAPDKPLRVPTMYQQSTFRFVHADGVKVLHLPYRGAKAPSMILVLPDAINGLADVESKLTSERFRVWEQSARSQEVKVWLPKFKFESDLQLSGTLAKLGMSAAFAASSADFSGISSTDSNQEQPLFIQHVIQRAVVEVDEEGTEAAAATSTTTTSAEPGGPPPRPLEFRADHPFLFFIQDKETGAILFMGRVADPSKE